ncbi:hypothetical protein [Williamsia deligens]|uniref:Uncharacterized protein n=1 Tax=Williamsia deligens TaxID=321325 RepID=A0ABW3G9S7_9NOCA|nr:hypothetical protein [Williamsia deligens]
MPTPRVDSAVCSQAVQPDAGLSTDRPAIDAEQGINQWQTV